MKTAGKNEREVARRLGVTQPAVNQAVKRGARMQGQSYQKLTDQTLNSKGDEN